MEASDTGGPTVPGSEEVGSEMVMFSIDTAARLMGKDFDIHKLEPQSLKEIIDSMSGVGVSVGWDERIAESDRERMLAERLPRTKLALIRNTRGHYRAWEQALPLDALEFANDMDDLILKEYEGEVRGIIGTAGMHLRLLLSDAMRDPKKKPIYNPYQSDGGMFRIRTSSATSTQQKITIEVSHETDEVGNVTRHIKLVPQFNPKIDPDSDEPVELSSEKVSARTYIMIVPKEVADKIEPRFDKVLTMPDVEQAASVFAPPFLEAPQEVK